MPSSIRTLVVSILLAMPCLATAGAQSSVITFTTVDGFSAKSAGFDITGTLQGASQVGTVSLDVQSSVKDSCERMLMLMIEKPGRFTFSTEGDRFGMYRCSVTRVR